MKIPLKGPSDGRITISLRRSKYLLTGLHLLLVLILSHTAKGQTPTDGLMMPSKNACVLLSYDFGRFDHYWEGDYLRTNETIATVHRTTVLPMAAIGIFDDLDLYLSLPYVKTRSLDPNGGKFAGAEGFQDLGIALKYRAMEKPMGNGRLSLFSTLGYTTPATNYLSDYMPYSLGFGAPEVALRGIFKYQLNKGYYARIMIAHLWRGYTEAERDYYYNNGSYYSATMDVPNAWNYEGVLGAWFMNNSLRVELNYSALKSTSGDDIRAYNAPQPTNKVKFDRIGLFAQYYFKAVKGLGVVTNLSHVVNGLNTGKFTNIALGVTYQFNYLKEKKQEDDEQ